MGPYDRLDMSTEPVERKADGDAEGTPGRSAADVAEESGFESSGQENGSATGRLLTSGGLPSGVWVARLVLAALLFGGVVLVVAGGTGYVWENFGLYPTLAVLGVGSVVFAYLLAQVYAYRGWV